jgi:hypothetical protein
MSLVANSRYKLLHEPPPLRRRASSAGGGVVPTFRGAALTLQTSQAHHEVCISGPSETGKTYAALWYLDSLLREHAGAQAVIVRKVRVTLYSSALQTYQKIIEQRGGVTPYGGKTPEWYDYTNGSRLWVAGMDNPGKALSSERDFVYENQAEELEEADHETLTTRATGRAANAPFSQLIIDCNPGPEDHWIIQRRDGGHLCFLQSRHEDNPTLFDDTGTVTERGRRTIATLDALTGARYWRLRMGLWVGAEGQHFEAWDEEKHVIKAPPEITGDWVIWGGLDYGYGHPFAFGVFGQTPNRDVHIMAEFVTRKTLIPDLAAGCIGAIRSLGLTPDRLRCVAAGHDMWATRGGDDSESLADKWEKAVRAQVGHNALALERAIVDRVNGAAAIQEGLGNATRPPTLFVWERCAEVRRAIPRMVTDPRNAEDVKKVNADAQGRGGDDPYDMARYGLMARPAPPIVVTRPKTPKPNLFKGY